MGWLFIQTLSQCENTRWCLPFERCSVELSRRNEIIILFMVVDFYCRQEIRWFLSSGPWDVRSWWQKTHTWANISLFQHLLHTFNVTKSCIYLLCSWISLAGHLRADIVYTLHLWVFFQSNSRWLFRLWPNFTAWPFTCDCVQISVRDTSLRYN